MISLAFPARPRCWIAVVLLVSFLLLPIALACLVLLVPGVMAPSIGDDAFFFVRYAQNFLEDGRFAWNSGEAASFGNTSQLYQFWIAAVQAAIGYDPVRVLAIGSQLPFILCVGIVLAAVLRMLREEGLEGRGTANQVLMLAGIAILCSPKFAHTAWSGMDTALAAVTVAVYAVLVDGIERRSTWAQIAIIAFGGWIMILARPELGLIAVGVPAALVLGRGRVHPWIVPGLAALALLVTASLGAAWLLYGDLLPLPFYVKSLGVTGYADDALSRYGFGNVEEVLRLLRDHCILAVLILAFAARAMRDRPGWWGLLAGSAAFMLYQALGNAVPITGGAGRFFMPIYPILVLAAVRALLAGFGACLLSPQLLAACLAVQTLLFAGPYASLIAHALAQAPQAWAVRNDIKATLLLNWPIQPNKWPALDRMEQLPAGCAVATSELGLIGVLYPDLRLVDLSGLVNPQLRNGFNAKWLLTKARPDILFPGSAEFYWGERLSSNPVFHSAYTILQVSHRVTRWPVAVRKDSVCGHTYAAILQEEERKLRP